MREDIAKTWVEALRSNDYKQGYNYLKAKDCFCCLGVLCDIYIKEHPDCTWESIEQTNGNLALMPKSVLEWADMKYVNGYLPDLWEGNSLAFLNDGLGMSFADIATIIENNYKAL